MSKLFLSSSFAFLFLATLGAPSAFAEVNAKCTAYKGAAVEYELALRIGDQAAEVEVLTARDDSRDYSLDQGAKVSLRRVQLQSQAYLDFEGVVQGVQVLGFSVKKNALSQARFQAELSISDRENPFKANMHALRCSH